MAAAVGKKTSLVVVASVSAVEALKDQAGLCRWNYALSSVQQRIKSSMASLSDQAVSKPSSYVRGARGRAEKVEHSVESMRKVLYLNSWGLN